MTKNFGTSVWTQATPKQQVARLRAELATTPRWKLFKRSQIKQGIEYWANQVRG